MNDDIKKVLIIKLRKIGDVLLSVPTIKAIREHLPDSHITALVNKGTEEMLTGNPLLNEVLAFDRSVKELAWFPALLAQIDFFRQIRKKNFDLVVDLTSGDRPAIIAKLSGARYRLGHDPRGQGFMGKKYFYTHLAPHTGKQRHAVEDNLEVARLLGIDTADKKVSIFTSLKDQAQVDKWLEGVGKPIVHVHPTSDWLFKCWRDEAVAELIDYLQEKKQMQVVLTSGPAAKETRKIEAILKLAHTRPLNLTGRTSLKQLAAISKRSKLFFGMDSAPMHIAAAVDTPVVALFGPSGEHMWGPWGKGHTVITKKMDCRPCGKDGCNNSKRSKCLEDITVAEVKTVLDKYLQ